MQTREKLLEAGREVFANRGVDAATIEDITETADVGRGSFYNFFDTKEDLVEAIVAGLIDDLLALEAIVGVENDDPLTALAVAIRSAFAMITNDGVLAWFIVRTQKISGPISEKFVDATRPLVEQGLASGQLTVGNADVALVVLGGGILAALEMLLLGRLQQDTIDQLVKHLLIGLGARPAACSKAVSVPLPTLAVRA